MQQEQAGLAAFAPGQQFDLGVIDLDEAAFGLVGDARVNQSGVGGWRPPNAARGGSGATGVAG